MELAQLMGTPIFLKMGPIGTGKCFENNLKLKGGYKDHEMEGSKIKFIGLRGGVYIWNLRILANMDKTSCCY